MLDVAVTVIITEYNFVFARDSSDGDGIQPNNSKTLTNDARVSKDQLQLCKGATADTIPIRTWKNDVRYTVRYFSRLFGWDH